LISLTYSIERSPVTDETDEAMRIGGLCPGRCNIVPCLTVQSLSLPWGDTCQPRTRSGYHKPLNEAPIKDEHICEISVRLEGEWYVFYSMHPALGGTGNVQKFCNNITGAVHCTDTTVAAIFQRHRTFTLRRQGSITPATHVSLIGRGLAFPPSMSKSL
jgi:hypothetical protein